VAQGGLAVASVVCAAPAAARHLDVMRANLPAHAGVSALDDDMLVARIVAEDGFALRKALIPLLERLSDADMPRTWMI
jgi:Urease accessory protein UreH